MVLSTLNTQKLHRKIRFLELLALCRQSLYICINFILPFSIWNFKRKTVYFKKRIKKTDKIARILSVFACYLFHQEFIHCVSRLSALSDCPYNKTLTSATVTCRKHASKTCLVVLFLGKNVASSVNIKSKLF